MKQNIQIELIKDQFILDQREEFIALWSGYLARPPYCHVPSHEAIEGYLEILCSSPEHLFVRIKKEDELLGYMYLIKMEHYGAVHSQARDELLRAGRQDLIERGYYIDEVLMDAYDFKDLAAEVFSQIREVLKQKNLFVLTMAGDPAIHSYRDNGFQAIGNDFALDWSYRAELGVISRREFQCGLMFL